jgi:hypothetical protein
VMSKAISEQKLCETDAISDNPSATNKKKLPVARIEFPHLSTCDHHVVDLWGRSAHCG